MHRYFAVRKGRALFRISAIMGPVKRAVESPAGPHEKPFDFRTVFCSLRRLPAQTIVIGDVNWSYCCKICRKLRVKDFSTSLDEPALDIILKTLGTNNATNPSTVISQLGISSSWTRGTDP